MPFELMDRRVAIAVHRWEELRSFGFDGPVCYCKVVEKDAHGVWIENEEWRLAPPGPHGDEFRLIHFLIPWHNIVAVGTFPKEKTSASVPGKIASVV